MTIKTHPFHHAGMLQVVLWITGLSCAYLSLVFFKVNIEKGIEISDIDTCSVLDVGNHTSV